MDNNLTAELNEKSRSIQFEHTTQSDWETPKITVIEVASATEVSNGSGPAPT